MTVRELTDIQLDSIARDKVKQDNINAVLEINPDALTLADELDKKQIGDRGI